MTNKEKAKILRKASEVLERLKKFVQQKSEPACQARRETFRFLVKYLGLLNKARVKYGIHGPLEAPLRQLKYLANKSEIKDLGTYVTLDRDLTQPKLSDGEEISFIDQLNLWANKCEKDKTEQNATKRGRLKPILCAISGLVVFLAALLAVFDYLGWLEPIRVFISNIVSHN